MGLTPAGDGADTFVIAPDKHGSLDAAQGSGKVG
jgi:hypothetical protein